MELERRTSHDLLDIQQQLIDREPIFHRPEYGTTRAAFAAMMADDYWEVGASGRRYSKEHILRVLEERHAQKSQDAGWTTEDFYCQRIASDNYLLTYTLHQSARPLLQSALRQNIPHQDIPFQNGPHKNIPHQSEPDQKIPDVRTRTTRRATLWRHTPRGWLIVFHQGTIVERTV